MAAASLPHCLQLDGARYEIRPVAPHDAAAVLELLRASPPDDIRLRFFAAIRRFNQDLVAALAHCADSDHLGLIARDASVPEPACVGHAHLVRTGVEEAEFAVLVRADQAHHGLGRHLLECILCGAAERGIRQVYGIVLRGNGPMLQLAREMGFSIRPDPVEPGCLRVEKDLRQAVAQPASIASAGCQTQYA